MWSMNARPDGDRRIRPGVGEGLDDGTERIWGAMAEMWRTGTKQGRNIYRWDVEVAVAVGPERDAVALAQTICGVMNARQTVMPYAEDLLTQFAEWLDAKDKLPASLSQQGIVREFLEEQTGGFRSDT
jgi:hypothetical protein